MNIELNTSFWNKIRNLIKLYHLNFLWDLVGKDYLSDEEIDFLDKNLGKSKISINQIPLLDKIFAFGQIAQKIGFENSNKITKKDLEDWLKDNKIEITKQLEKVKAQAYLDVLSKQFKIEKDLRQGILNEANKEEFKMSNVVEYIKEKFEDWSYLRDTVSYISESALNEGKIEEIKNKTGKRKEEIWVIKVPILDDRLCSSCRKAYLNSDGTPKIFKLSELESNGTNIGRKYKSWLPTLGELHPHCRCLLQEFELLPNTTFDDYYFDENKQRYILKEKKEHKVERKSKVIIWVGEKKFEV